MVEKAELRFRSEPFKTAFPRLAHSGSIITSDPDCQYNCIAWAAGERYRRWWPGQATYWPSGLELSSSRNSFIAAYRTIGYSQCDDDRLEDGIQKIALYVIVNRLDRLEKVTHAALQLPCGKWTSKLGDREDIVHPELNDLEGPEYGKVACFLSRSISV